MRRITVAPSFILRNSMPDSRTDNRTPLSTQSVEAVGSLVGEFIEEKSREQREEKARQGPRKRNPLVLPLMTALCLAVWIAPSLIPQRESQIAPELVERSARLNLYLTSLRVREYRARHKRLPADLVQAGADTTGISYSPLTNSEFELSTRVQGARMVFRSAQPDSVFLGANLRVRGIS